MSSNQDFAVPKLNLLGDEANVNQHPGHLDSKRSSYKSTGRSRTNRSQNYPSSRSYASGVTARSMYENTQSMTDLERLNYEKLALTRKLYDINASILLAQSVKASHKLENIVEAPSREEAKRAFYRNRYGTVSQQTYAFSPAVNDVQKQNQLAPTERNRRKQTDLSRYAQVASKFRAGSLNR